jgi:D-alanyl-D-alanine carboxypeptidase
MSPTAAARTRARRPLWPTAVGLVVVAAVITGTLVYQSASSSAPSFSKVLRGDRGRATIEAEGALPDGVTVFDNEYAGIANLNPDLLQALREAATDAADDGIEFYVNSGWRSPEYQNQLLREAVSKYGSEEEAARWVATADASPHVSGDAVDIGPYDAMAWLSGHGAEYGLCQIYGNEPWHYELRPHAIDHGCPATYVDPTHDPRMQQ